MKICKALQDGTYIPYTPREVKADYPNVSFPRSWFEPTNVAKLEPYSVFEYTDNIPVVDPLVEKAVRGDIINTGGIHTQEYSIVPLSAEELAVVADMQDELAVKNLTVLRNFMQAGPTGIETYIANNVTNLVEAKQVLTMLAKIVWVVARNNFKG